MKIGIIGSGIVAQTLAAGFIKHGHDVTLGTRDASQLAEYARKTPGVRVASGAEAAAFGDVVVLAVKGIAMTPLPVLAVASVLGGAVLFGLMVDLMKIWLFKQLRIA